jgi:hypothetical protein
MLLTGFSAGGVGSTVTYPLVRGILQPTGNASLLADSGPLMPAPRSGTSTQYPSLPLHEKIRDAWGLDGPDGLVTRFAGLLTGFDANDLGSVSGAPGPHLPGDRFGFMLITRDTNYSAFRYEKVLRRHRQRRQLLRVPRSPVLALVPDIARWTASLATYANVSFTRALLPQRQRFALPDDRSTSPAPASSRPALATVGRRRQHARPRPARCATTSPRTPPPSPKVLSPFVKLYKLLSDCRCEADGSRRVRGTSFAPALPSGKRAASFLSLPRSALTPAFAFFLPSRVIMNGESPIASVESRSCPGRRGPCS